MFEKILLPLDGSRFAERSVPHALKFARVFGSQILLLRVLEPSLTEDGLLPAEPLQWQLLRAKTEVSLHESANHIRKALGLEEIENETETEGHVRVAILDGKAAESIVDFAQKDAADLVVMSSHGLGGLSRWNLNSVTAKVFAQVHTNMLIIRAYLPEKEEPESSNYDQIVVALDGSRRSECSLNAAVAFANVTGSKLTLASVLKPIEIPEAEPYQQELQRRSNDLFDLMRQAWNFYLQELSQRLPVANEIQLLEGPSVVQALLNLADEKQADLLTICAHGFSGDASFPYGSLARGFVEFSTRPVLIIQDQPVGQAQPGEAARVAEQTKSRE